MPVETDHLAWALRALKDNDRFLSYREARAYYDTGKPTGGKLELLGTKKFREVFGAVFNLSDNLCAAVVDSVADRLRITGVNEGVNGTQALADQAWEIWQRNRMDVRAPETHIESLMTGDGYALVWPNQQNEAVIWSLSASQMAVSYDPGRPGVLRSAARVWCDEEEAVDHLDIYLPDRVDRYTAERRRNRDGRLSSQTSTLSNLSTAMNASRHTLVTEDNPYKIVPVVHFPNRRYHAYGVSELEIVVPLQRALNKTLCDMMVAQEFSAFKQRWATGLDVGDVDATTGKPTAPPFDYGQDRILTSADHETRFGDFSSTDITQYVEVLENHRAEISRVSGIPLHYLFITKGDFPSGEAMKSAEARFTQKVQNRQASFGNQWEDLLALALRVEGNDTAEGPQLSLEWKPAEPMGLLTPPATGPKPRVAAEPAAEPDAPADA